MTQRECTFEQQVAKRLRLHYLLSFPQDYGADPHRKWPLILFLHGGGERGDDLNLVRVYGIPKVVDRDEAFPAIAVSPQCPAGSAWHEHVDALDALLDRIAEEHAVDADRVYLTGMSMGGYGTWLLAALYPERFAALVPICGGGLWYLGFPQKACVLKHVPIWVFHGGEDDVLPLSDSQRIVDALRGCDANVRFTIYPGVGHDSWTQTYDNPELYAWLFAQRRGNRPQNAGGDGAGAGG